MFKVTTFTVKEVLGAVKDTSYISEQISPEIYKKCIQESGFALRFGLKNPVIRDLIERSIIDGNFKHVPELGHGFLNKVIEICSDEKIPDNQIYPILREYFANLIQQNGALTEAFAMEREGRVKSRIDEVRKILNGISVTKVTDIGCGDGQIITALKTEFRIPRQDVTGLEVFVRPDVEKEFVLTKFDGRRLPLEDNSQDLITIFAVLHHSDNPKELIDEAYRILKPGGHVILRDFDSETNKDKLFQLIMDQMLYEVYTPYPDVPIPGSYASMKDWLNFFRKSGFSASNYERIGGDSHPYKPFIALFKKYC